MNQLPEVRRFIKTSGEADSYKGLKINYIPGHNPDLVFFDENAKETQRVDLSPFTGEEIHNLLGEKGFQQKEVEHVKCEIRTCMG